MNWVTRYSSEIARIIPTQSSESILQHMLTPVEEGGHGLQDAYDMWTQAYKNGETAEDPSDPEVAVRLLSLHDGSEHSILKHRHPKVK